ncbi:HD domain-containing protein [candidate division KSB1 bacterium]|nr:HD domain-containing protein [candidate division KSB1 bacterium]
MQSENLPFRIIQKHYAPMSESYRILVIHSVLVANKALAIATAYQQRHPEVALDLRFLEEAALLHDIGIFRCHAPEIHCFGAEPYIKHGIIGRAILEEEGLPRHALVCERHTGAGLTKEDVRAQQLPLPMRDYLPLSFEEKIICLADRFYVKEPAALYRPLSLERIGEKMAQYGAEALARWKELRSMLAE